MTLQQILNFVNFVIRKSQAGDTMTPEQYNDLLAGFNVQMFHDELQQVEVMAKAQGIPMYRALHTASALLRYIQYINLQTNAGITNTPDDYVHYIGIISVYNGAVRDIDVISREEMNNRRSSLLESQLNIKPAAIIEASTIFVFPKDVGSTALHKLEFSYLRMPCTPIYDYCLQESTGKYFYMPVGSFINNSNNFYLFGATSPTAVNVYHPNKVVGTQYTSTTVELDWDERFIMRFVQALLQAAVPSYNPELLSQYTKEMPK
jgi:hypothetical protein